jgi:predicted nucleotidyltransferase
LKKGFADMERRDKEQAIDAIKDAVLRHYPNAQAIYLFGSYQTENEWPDSDVDVAVLLSPEESGKAGSLMISELYRALGSMISKEVDIVNLRRVPTVLQKEIVMADRRIYTGNRYATEEFEMLTMSFYQKLNEERAGIIERALKDGRFHEV